MHISHCQISSTILAGVAVDIVWRAAASQTADLQQMIVINCHGV